MVVVVAVPRVLRRWGRCCRLQVAMAEAALHARCLGPPWVDKHLERRDASCWGVFATKSLQAVHTPIAKMATGLSPSLRE